MIQSIRLHNFQLHEDREIELGRFCTTLRGASRVGKSSILRALRWLVFNRPSGSDFIRHGTKGTRVSVIADGRKVSRVKGEKNLYVLDGKKLAAFGAGVPEAISNLFNLSPANFASQHDTPFMLLSSPPEVSRELNAVVNLDLIDRVMGRAAAQVRKAASAVEFSKNRLKGAREARDRLAWVREAEADLNTLEALERKAGEGREKRTGLAQTLEKVKVVEEDCRNAAKAELGALAVLETGRKALKLEERASILRGLLEAIATKDKELAETDKNLEKVATELDKFKSCPVCGKPMNGE